MLVDAAFNIVIAGAGGGNAALEVQLIAGKLASSSSLSGEANDACHILFPNDQALKRRSQYLMHGKGNEEGETATATTRGPFLISTANEIGDALATADGLIVACDADHAAMEPSRIDIFLNNAPNLKHVALLSQMGGIFKALESHVKRMCADKDIDCSIVRAGIFKGGGPGEKLQPDEDDERAVVAQEEEFGLNRYYYDTIIELSKAQNTMAFDRFTLGAKVTAGDPFSQPNMFQKMAQHQSFDPADTDTGRSAAAAALLYLAKEQYTISRDNDDEGSRLAAPLVDVTLTTAKSSTPPTQEEWRERFATASGEEATAAAAT